MIDIKLLLAYRCNGMHKLSLYVNEIIRRYSGIELSAHFSKDWTWM